MYGGNIQKIVLDRQKTIISSPTQLLLVGGFTSYNGLSSNRIVVINNDGSKNNSLNRNIGTGFNSGVSRIVSHNNKYLVVGSFTGYNNTGTANRIILLNNDFSRDNTFSAGSGFDNAATRVKIINNKFLITGSFTSYNGISANRIVQLNNDGSIDNTFNYGTGANSGILSIDVDSLNNIYVVGSSTALTSYNDTSVGRVFKLNQYGALDTSFNIGTGFASSLSIPFNNVSIAPITCQSDDKILIGGTFTSYNGSSRNHIVRINNDGSIDNTFNIGTGFSTGTVATQVQAIAIDSDNKIIVGGAFSSYQGVSSNRIIRLNSDGSRDSSFNVGTGVNTSGTINSIFIDQNNKILIGGNSFATYNGVSVNRIARLNTDGSLDTTFDAGSGFTTNNTFADGLNFNYSYYG